MQHAASEARPKAETSKKLFPDKAREKRSRGGGGKRDRGVYGRVSGQTSRRSLRDTAGMEPVEQAEAEAEA